MRLYVVDCSFAMAWVFADERNPLADALLDRLDAALALAAKAAGVPRYGQPD